MTEKADQHNGVYIRIGGQDLKLPENLVINDLEATQKRLQWLAPYAELMKKGEEVSGLWGEVGDSQEYFSRPELIYKDFFPFPNQLMRMAVVEEIENELETMKELQSERFLISDLVKGILLEVVEFKEADSTDRQMMDSFLGSDEWKAFKATYELWKMIDAEDIGLGPEWIYMAQNAIDIEDILKIIPGIGMLLNNEE